MHPSLLLRLFRATALLAVLFGSACGGSSTGPSSAIATLRGSVHVTPTGAP